MTGVGGDTGRGVRVAARSVRTWRRIADLVAIVVLLSALIGGIWKTQTAATAYEWHLMGVYALSEFLLAAGFHPDKDKRMRTEAGEVHVTTAECPVESCEASAETLDGQFDRRLRRRAMLRLRPGPEYSIPSQRGRPTIDMIGRMLCTRGES